MVDHPSPQSFIDPKDVLSRAEDAATSADMSSSASHTDAAAKTSPDTPKKKRKSWGQVLPIPTTNLPPRKRAKTAEEKAQRHYERVQRNRLAAHNSRMRKQDEMDRVVAENNQLKQDNQHQMEEIKRLQDELAYVRSCQTNPRQFTPPLDTSPVFSEYSDPASPPSLTSTSTNGASSPADLLDATFLSPQGFPALPSDMKQFDDSHSAEMCSQQWTWNSQRKDTIPPVSVLVPQSHRPNAGPADVVTFDDLLNLEGLDESHLNLPAGSTEPTKSLWDFPTNSFDAFGANEISLFPQDHTVNLSASTY